VPVPWSSMLLSPVRAEDCGWPVLGLAFAFGACVGSFLNVCIYRLPADQSVVSPGSRCPQCGTPIGWRDNIPIFSWLALGARCRACHTPNPGRYPLVEGATGALAALALGVFGATAAAAVAFIFTAALLLITFVDLDHLFIPDEVSLPGIGVGIAAAFLPGGITPLDAVAGTLLGGGILWAVAWSYERLTGLEGMGFGDVKLLAMIGAFLGWQAIPAVLVIASLTGSFAGMARIFSGLGRRRMRRVLRRFGPGALLPFVRRTARRTEIPFGPFLALGAVVALYHPSITVPSHFG